MSLRLQEFGFRKSRYERPTQDWVCGRAGDGQACEIGPDRRGRCRATFECAPLRKGDRWHCTRSEHQGGPCEDGPLSDGTCSRPIPRCQPVRSPRARRGSAAQWVTALTIGGLLLILAGSSEPTFISPGDLTFKHSEVRSCAACHTAFEGRPGGWLLAAFAPSPPGADSKLCLVCHKLGDDGLKAHGLPPQRLTAISERAKGTLAGGGVDPFAVTLAALTLDAPEVDGGVLPCATCHQEHRGKDFHLTAIGNRRCQACHITKFASLTRGHPPFSAYPYERRTRIKFDHASHIGKHFPAEAKVKAPTACTGCHTPDPSGGAMLVKSFDEACAGCHGKQIEGEGRAGAKGITVLALPGLDMETLRDKGVAIGEWPDDAEGEITPFLHFLLATDATIAADLATLAGVDLLDLLDVERHQIEAVEGVAWAVKGLLFDLASRGQQELKARLERALGRQLDNREVAALAALLPVDALRAAQQAWLPNLASDIGRHRAGQIVPIPGLEADTAVPAEAAGETDAEEGSAALLTDEILGENGDILDEEEDEILAEEDGDILGADESDILGEEEEGAILDEDEEGILDEEEEGDILAGEDADILADEAEPSESAALATAAEELDESLPDEERMLAGGWYRDDFSLLYRPSGHADRFLRAWLDATANVGGMPGEAAARKIFTMLSRPREPGMCTKCHSVDAAGREGRRVNWLPAQPEADVHAFTRFAHAPHFSLLDDKGCQTCHGLDPDADFMAGFQDMDPTSFASNFKPVARAVCGDCHVEELAGEACTICHNYHVGRIAPVMMRAPLAEAGKATSQ